MELLKKLPIAALVALIATLAGIAPANAQEAKDEFQQLVEDCQAELDYSPEGSLDRKIDEAITQTIGKTPFSKHSKSLTVTSLKA